MCPPPRRRAAACGNCVRCAGCRGHCCCLLNLTHSLTHPSQPSPSVRTVQSARDRHLANAAADPEHGKAPSPLQTIEQKFEKWETISKLHRSRFMSHIHLIRSCHVFFCRNPRKRNSKTPSPNPLGTGHWALDTPYQKPSPPPSPSPAGPEVAPLGPLKTRPKIQTTPF